MSLGHIAVLRWDDKEACNTDELPWRWWGDEKKKKQIKRAHITVTHIFPYSAQCMVPYQFTRNSRNHGCGYDKFKFPTEILEAACKLIIDKLKLTGRKTKDSVQPSLRTAFLL